MNSEIHLILEDALRREKVSNRKTLSKSEVKRIVNETPGLRDLLALNDSNQGWQAIWSELNVQPGDEEVDVEAFDNLLQVKAQASTPPSEELAGHPVIETGESASMAHENQHQEYVKLNVVSAAAAAALRGEDSPSPSTQHPPREPPVPLVPKTKHQKNAAKQQSGESYAAALKHAPAPEAASSPSSSQQSKSASSVRAPPPSVSSQRNGSVRSAISNATDRAAEAIDNATQAVDESLEVLDEEGPVAASATMAAKIRGACERHPVVTAVCLAGVAVGVAFIARTRAGRPLF